jgi:hypothetical protein
MEDVLDEQGNVIDHNGFFIYRDRSTLSSIEDIAVFIADLIDEQKKGNLPYDLLFMWDSVGSIPCQLSLDQGKNNPMWNAGAIATQFGNFINQQVVLSRKENYPYTNTLLIVNKTGVAPAETPMSRPRMTNKGGDTFYYDSSFIPDDAKIVSKYKKEHAHEWIDILGKGDYVIQEDDSEWSEKEHITDILEIDE